LIEEIGGADEPMEEREAIARLQKGDISALDVPVREYQVQAVRLAYLIIGDRHLAEDVVQAAFLRAFERSRQFDTERPFWPWFRRIVVNDAVKAATRSRQHIPLRSESDEVGSLIPQLCTDPDTSPEETAGAAELRQAVWTALQQLSPAQRAVVVQRYYLGMSEAEMADLRECAPGTVKALLHSARQRLRTLLGRFSPTNPAAKRLE